MPRFGIIGVGNTVAIAQQHVLALKKLPDIRITALLSRTRERAEVFAHTHCPDAVVCDTLEAFLALVDCVCICTPNQTHAAYAIAALQAGKGVLCEKPLGGTPEQLETLRQLSLRGAQTNLVGYNFRYQPPVRLLRQLLQDGKLGTILWYQEQKGGNRLADRSIPYEWRMDRASGGGSTMDFCSHMLDHYLYLSGECAAQLHPCSAQLRTFVPQRPDGHGGQRSVQTEDYTHLSLRGANGAAITLTASRVGVPEERIELVGTEGMASWCSRQPEQLLLWQKDARGVLPQAPQVLACPGTLQQTYDEQARVFVEAWQAQRAASPSLADGCELLRLLQTLLQMPQQ